MSMQLKESNARLEEEFATVSFHSSQSCVFSDMILVLQQEKKTTEADAHAASLAKDNSENETSIAALKEVCHPHSDAHLMRLTYFRRRTHL